MGRSVKNRRVSTDEVASAVSVFRTIATFPCLDVDPMRTLPLLPGPLLFADSKVLVIIGATGFPEFSLGGTFVLPTDQALLAMALVAADLSSFSSGLLVLRRFNSLGRLTKNRDQQ